MAWAAVSCRKSETELSLCHEQSSLSRAKSWAILAHRSALADGERLRVPNFALS